jgi:hypothetical protein
MIPDDCMDVVMDQLSPLLMFKTFHGVCRDLRHACLVRVLKDQKFSNYMHAMNFVLRSEKTRRKFWIRYHRDDSYETPITWHHSPQLENGQCCAITKKGARCTRKATGVMMKCWQHRGDQTVS